MSSIELSDSDSSTGAVVSAWEGHVTVGVFTRDDLSLIRLDPREVRKLYDFLGNFLSARSEPWPLDDKRRTTK